MQKYAITCVNQIDKSAEDADANLLNSHWPNRKGTGNINQRSNNF